MSVLGATEYKRIGRFYGVQVIEGREVDIPRAIRRYRALLSGCGCL